MHCKARNQKTKLIAREKLYEACQTACVVTNLQQEAFKVQLFSSYAS